MAAHLERRDVDVVARDWLDPEYQVQFAEPWFLHYADGRVIYFRSEDDACAAQRHHRKLIGLDPMTGLPS